MRTITVKDIYNEVELLNANRLVTDIEVIVEESSIKIAEELRSRYLRILPNESLSHKILSDVTKDFFSDKQLWVISYELQKNEAYVSNLANEIERREKVAERKAQESKAKLARNKENSQEVLDFVKSNKKLLKDYYAFVKSNKKYSKEFYSKRFTFESAREFLNC